MKTTRLLLSLLAALFLLIIGASAHARVTATWTKKAPVRGLPNGPGARGWMVITYDSLIKKTVLWGGSSATYQNDIWHYDSVLDTWTNDTRSDFDCTHFTPPTTRDEYSFLYDSGNNLYWMHGGGGYKCVTVSNATIATGSTTTTIVDPTLPSTIDDFYKDYYVTIEVSPFPKLFVTAYNAATKTLTMSAPASQIAPGAKYSMRPQFGGGTWYYSPVTRQWVDDEAPHWPTRGPQPFRRISGGFAYSPVDRAIVLFGGAKTLNDTWIMDTDSKIWTQALPNRSPGSPPSRGQIENVMVYDSANDVFVLFGGRCFEQWDASICPLNAMLGDTWVYKISTNRWTKMNPPVSPAPRNQHYMAYDKVAKKVILFGGRNSAVTPNIIYGDTWIYDYPSNTWTEITPAVSPSPRYLGAISYDPDQNLTVLYSGSTATGGASDLWHLKLSGSGGGGGDGIPPTVTITSPGAGAVAGTIPVNVNATDNVGVTKVELYVRGVLAGTELSQPYSFSLNTTTLADGAATLVARGYDAAGNIGLSSTVTVTIANGEIIVDNANAGVQDPTGGRTFTGTWCKSARPSFYGANSLYSCGTGLDTYRWTPKIPIGRTYDVYVRWTSYFERSTAAPYTVVHAGGSNTVQFNQQVNPAVWTLHGRYTFNAGASGYVQLSDVNGQAAADAVRLVPVP